MKRLREEDLINNPKEKKYVGPKEKGGGTTNEQKNKSKPLTMLRPKKNKERNRYFYILFLKFILQNEVGQNLD